MASVNHPLSPPGRFYSLNFNLLDPFAFVGRSFTTANTGQGVSRNKAVKKDLTQYRILHSIEADKPDGNIIYIRTRRTCLYQSVDPV